MHVTHTLSVPMLCPRSLLILATPLGSSTHLGFSTKRMLITALSFPTTQRLHSFKFTLVNKSHSQHSEAAVRCLGRHFLILYACAHEVSFPDRRPRSLVWKREYTSERAGMVGTGFFPPRHLARLMNTT